MVIIYNGFALLELLFPVAAALVTPDPARGPVALATYALSCAYSEATGRGGRVFFIPTSILAFGLLPLALISQLGVFALVLAPVVGIGAFLGLRTLRKRRMQAGAPGEAAAQAAQAAPAAQNGQPPQHAPQHAPPYAPQSAPPYANANAGAQR